MDDWFSEVISLRERVTSYETEITYLRNQVASMKALLDVFQQEALSNIKSDEPVGQRGCICTLFDLILRRRKKTAGNVELFATLSV